MSLRVLTFDNADNTFAKDHAALFHNINTNESNGILKDISNEVGFSLLANTLNYDSGYINIQGRLIGVEDGSLEIPYAAIGTTEYGYVIVKIDLDQVGTNQVELTTKSQTSTLPTLVQEDLNKTGEIYEFPILSYEVTDSNLVTTEDLRTYLEKRTEYVNTFTEIAQLGLTDADFSSSDFESNYLKIYDKLTKSSMKVSKLTTVLRTPAFVGGNDYQNLINSLNATNGLFENSNACRIDISVPSTEDRSIKSSIGRPNIIKLYSATNKLYLGIFTNSFQGFKLITNNYKTLEELGLSDASFSTSDFGFNIDVIMDAMLPYTKLKLTVDSSTQNLSDSILVDLRSGVGTLTIEKGESDSNASTVRFTTLDGDNYIGSYSTSWDSWKTINPVELYNDPSGIVITTNDQAATILVSASTASKFNSFKLLVGDEFKADHYIEVALEDSGVDNFQTFVYHYSSSTSTGYFITAFIGLNLGNLIGNSASRRAFGSTSQTSVESATVYEVWGIKK